MEWCHLPALIIWVLLLQRSHQTCFYKGCNPGQEEMLNLHLVPHTHDDVGWTSTVSNYYQNSVSSIINSTIAALLSNSTYRFTYVEMAYFHKWWNEQSTTMQAQVHELVQSGRLQFALGGWVMADEATVYYGDEIDQLTKGRDLLKRLFGSCGRPRVSWPIDVFGHARDNADLFLQASYDSTFFQRIHYVEKEQRRSNRSLEFLWNPNVETDQLNNNAPYLFTHVFYDTHCYIKGTCMGVDCRYEVFSDEMPQWKVDLFLETIQLWSQSFRTNHILVPMGCDFAYVDAATNFKIMNNLIDRINGLQLGSHRLNAFYSTPACYTQAVNRYFHAHDKLSTRTGDFFPYADQKHNYWSGFYTSRPALKSFVRQQSNLLTAVEQLNVFTPVHVYSTSIDELRQWVAILQHHDAVSGTEQQHVANDYINNLYKAGEFFTDSAGRRLVRRLRNLTNADEIAANYYPVVNRIMLKGPRENSIEYSEMPVLGMAVYTDRAQGGTSLQDGQIELMVHRRLVEDDRLGVDEALLEQGADDQGGYVGMLNILSLWKTRMQSSPSLSTEQHQI
ncbi:Lysosomal alpha-mannosidase [Paragonimus heterotremus]|uniref:Lysosomal alpha-mannosidase n=1 Tax=Paragonimus heterotremus TaxID=100268 RepID=A0A8J4TBP2_9TREM|nr:Lysosomal alpha-mannosidase [Paragonimus heterotremus]